VFRRSAYSELMTAPRRSLACLCAAALMFGGACSPTVLGGDTEAQAPAQSVELVQSSARPGRSDTAKMLRGVLPSVVNVRVRSLSVGQFGAQQARGQGSGVVIDRSGIILTNAHVIRDAIEVEVVFTDDREPMTGRVLGQVPERDLAVLQVDAGDLDPIPIGHSEPPWLNLGDPVVAVGFPLGLGGVTVTKGIVSGQERTITVGQELTGVTHLEGLLQTDAAINPGNSGGALVDMDGRLVGINSAGAAAGAAENIGFAIAIDNALPVIEEILSQPRRARAWLGVQVVGVDRVVASQIGVPPDTVGAAVVGVIPGSPAERAGIEPGDVIVGIGGTSIEAPSGLTESLTEQDPGDEVTLDLVDPDGRRSVTVRLAPRPPAFSG
jgi:serine protease DegS/serine protease DegQ